MVRLALYKNVVWWDLGAWVIRKWTGSPYSHTELVIGDMFYSSSIQDGGVRAKVIEPDSDKWDFIDLPWADQSKVLDYYDQTMGQAYGWYDLPLQQLFNTHIDGRGRLCSGWCAAALGLDDGDSFWPGLLGMVCKWVNSL